MDIIERGRSVLTLKGKYLKLKKNKWYKIWHNLFIILIFLKVSMLLRVLYKVYSQYDTSLTKIKFIYYAYYLKNTE